MGKEDVLTALKALPEATIIASHMEAVNHAALSRADLKAYIKEQQIEDSVLVPEDGESINL